MSELDPTNPLPSRPNRKAWKEKEKAGKNRNGKDLPKVASKQEAKAFVKELAKEAIAAVVEDKTVSTVVKEKYAAMSSIARAHIFSYLGDDIEAARSEFARELLANARKVSQHIMGEFESYPPSVKSFLLCAYTDKASNLMIKTGVTAAGAQVGQQVNVFMDGTVDRERLIAQLTGQAFQPKPVEVAATPIAS